MKRRYLTNKQYVIILAVLAVLVPFSWYIAIEVGLPWWMW